MSLNKSQESERIVTTEFVGKVLIELDMRQRFSETGSPCPWIRFAVALGWERVFVAQSYSPPYSIDMVVHLCIYHS